MKITTYNQHCSAPSSEPWSSNSYQVYSGVGADNVIQSGAAVSPILPPQDGYFFQDKAKFPASFAADVDAEKAAFWADSQVPWGVAASRDYPLERLGWESEFQTSHGLTGSYSGQEV